MASRSKRAVSSWSVSSGGGKDSGTSVAPSPTFSRSAMSISTFPSADKGANSASPNRLVAVDTRLLQSKGCDRQCPFRSVLVCSVCPGRGHLAAETSSINISAGPAISAALPGRQVPRSRPTGPDVNVTAMPHATSLQGKTMFISGASRGIGLAIAKRAAQDGANIALIAKTAEPHPKLPGTVYTAAKELEEAGGQALPIVGDVRDPDSVAAAVTQTVEQF